MKCIVSTRTDRGVSVTRPTAEAMAFLTGGGAPPFYFGGPLHRDYEIAKLVKGGTHERIAVRWVDALISGGCTDAEAYELIRDKDTPDDWTGKELWPDVPGDRWFRDAWTRSHNGGPLDIDMDKARRIHWRKLKSRQDGLIRALEPDAEYGDMTALRSIERLRSIDVLNAIKTAATPQELRRVWPEVLNTQGNA